MSVNVDAFRATQEPWSVEIDGRRFTARPVSWPAYLRWAQAEDAFKASGNYVAYLRELHLVLRAAFPVRWVYLWRPSLDAVVQIERLDPASRKEVLADFFDHLTAWTRTGASSPKPTDSSKPCSADGRPSSDGSAPLAGAVASPLPCS